MIHRKAETKLSGVVHECSPRSWETDKASSLVQGQPGIHIKTIFEKKTEVMEFPDTCAQNSKILKVYKWEGRMCHLHAHHKQKVRYHNKHLCVDLTAKIIMKRLQ